MNSCFRNWLCLLLVATWLASSVASLDADQPSSVYRGFFKPVRELTVDTRDDRAQPEDASEGLFQEQVESRQSRPIAETHVHWAPAELHYESLYFEELMLERHGVSVAPRLQPWISGAHFFGVAITLPYRLGVDHPHDIHYAFGRGRPGDAAPCVREQLPWDWDGALLQATAVTGVGLMVP